MSQRKIPLVETCSYDVSKDDLINLIRQNKNVILPTVFITASRSNHLYALGWLKQSPEERGYYTKLKQDSAETMYFSYIKYFVLGPGVKTIMPAWKHRSKSFQRRSFNV